MNRIVKITSFEIKLKYVYFILGSFRMPKQNSDYAVINDSHIYEYKCLYNFQNNT